MYLVHIEQDLGLQSVIYYIWTIFPIATISPKFLTLRVVGELGGIGYHFEVLLVTIY